MDYQSSCTQMYITYKTYIVHLYKGTIKCKISIIIIKTLSWYNFSPIKTTLTKQVFIYTKKTFTQIYGFIPIFIFLVHLMIVIDYSIFLSPSLMINLKKADKTLILDG